MNAHRASALGLAVVHLVGQSIRVEKIGFLVEHSLKASRHFVALPSLLPTGGGCDGSHIRG
jgi:hypothetical protein